MQTSHPQKDALKQQNDSKLHFPVFNSITQMHKDSGAERYADMTPSWRWLGLSWANDQIPLLPSSRSHTCPCDRRQGALYLSWLADKRAPICKHRRPPQNGWVPSTLDLSVITNANRRTDRSPACHSSRLQSCRKTPLSSPWSSKGQEDSLILCTREPFPPPVPGSNHLCKKFHPPANSSIVSDALFANVP